MAQGPPSGLPAISPSRGEILSRDDFRQSPMRTETRRRGIAGDALSMLKQV